MEKKLTFLLLSACLTLSGLAQKKDIIKENFDFASKQLPFAIEEAEGVVAEKESTNNGKPVTIFAPRSIDPDGDLILVASPDWCSGFFPGELWYMYEYTKDKKWEVLARRFTTPIEREKTNSSTHDMGFKVYCSFGNGYRLTNDPAYKDIMIESANTLITRYEPGAKIIRSWDFNKDKWMCPVIIDNMMNLELLFWASKETGDKKYYDIAVNHARTTIKNHFRPDLGTYHVVDYDPKTGDVKLRITHQGYADESTWARGEAWALYGYTMAYRETKLPEFLEQAKQIANFIFSNPNLPKDLVPYWDYNAPELPNEPRDVSAAAITASALYELSLYDKANAKQYKKWADTIVENISKAYKAKLNSDRGFLLLHSTGSKPSKSEVDVPLVYADYYYLEALLRKLKLETSGELF